MQNVSSTLSGATVWSCHGTTSGAPADGSSIADLAQLPDDTWISLAVRDNRLLPITGATELRAGDEIVVLDESDRGEHVAAAFIHVCPPASPD